MNSGNAYDEGQRDEQVLVVWCDETTAIVEQYRRMEHRLRHFVSDCTCGGGQYPLDLDASVKEQGDARYAGYDGNFDETVRKRLLDVCSINRFIVMIID